MKNRYILLLSLLLTACHQENRSILEETQIEQKPISTKIDVVALDEKLSPTHKELSVAEIKFHTHAYTYQMPDELNDNCHAQNPSSDDSTHQMMDFCAKIDIELTQVEPKWIEQIINKTITNDDSHKLIKFKQTLDNTLIKYTQTKTKPQIKNWDISPKMLPNFNQVAQVVIDSAYDTHTVRIRPHRQYLIFDMDLQSQISLYDIIIINQENEFYELAHRYFKKYLKENLGLKSQKEIKKYEQDWQFFLSKNFYLSDKGLVLAYQPNELAKVEQGFIELTLPFDDELHTLIKPQYLPTSTPKQPKT